jgi:hypothetical protein
MKSILLRSLLVSVPLQVMVLSGTALASDELCKILPCAKQIRGRVLDNSTAQPIPVPNNAEQVKVQDDQDEGFSVSIDGQNFIGDGGVHDPQRLADLVLEEADIQVKFDGLDVNPTLAVQTAASQESYNPGQNIEFKAHSNYSPWIKHSEIRIFKTAKDVKGTPIAVAEVGDDGLATWTMPAEGADKFVYVLRAYGANDKFDETYAQPLRRSIHGVVETSIEDTEQIVDSRDDLTALRNISIEGGTITVTGRNIPLGYDVTVLGSQVSVQDDGTFILQRMLPPGDHDVEISVLDKKTHKKGLELSRGVNIPANDWFYAALADFTVGRRYSSGNIADVRPGDYPDTFTKGRLAFYLKGKIQGKYLLTAAVDTGERRIEDVFSGLDAKDPRQFLKRISPDDYYPVYGDDSTSSDDAPTRGKFFVRLARGDSHVLWGTFKSQIKGTEFLRNERTLYGASAVFKPEGNTSFGERSTEASAYAAQPGTLPQRDEFLGTGGSAYFLKYQDITPGSETVSVEIRDSVTGALIERRYLKPDKDYDFEYIQGGIILKNPLPSVSGLPGGPNNFLIVNYEFTPASGNADGYVYGGRAQQWLGDHLRVGVTGAIEKTPTTDQKMAGADVHVRYSDKTYLAAEYAHSEGPGLASTTSTDGGYNLVTQPAAGSVGKPADAFRVQGHVDFSDFKKGAKNSYADGYFERLGAGFSSLGRQAIDGQVKYGVHVNVEPSDDVAARAGLDSVKSDNGNVDSKLSAEVSAKVRPDVTVTTGVTYVEHDTATLKESRTDLAAKADWAFAEGATVYGFGQATVAKTASVPRNDRVGLGVTYVPNDENKLSAEASYGTSGVAAVGLVEYRPKDTPEDQYYLGYRYNSNDSWANQHVSLLSGTDESGLIAGFRHSYTESLSVFTEDSYQPIGPRTSLKQNYGLKYAADGQTSLTAGVQSGKIWDNTINPLSGLKYSDFDRLAVYGTFAYKEGDYFEGHLKGEVRRDSSSDHSRDLIAYLIDTGTKIRISDDWRLIANLEGVFSDASDTTRNSAYVEGSVGYAYRPTTNDKLNALFKYTFLYDLPGQDQVTVGGATKGYEQISNILSVDASYDINEIVTLGAKYGLRVGATKDRAPGADWQSDLAQLGVVRLDIGIEKEWDALVEGRLLITGWSESTQLGVLAAVYKHMNENFKIGVGYNFGSFSDDLRDVKADSHGIFVNVVGKL